MRNLNAKELLQQAIDVEEQGNTKAAIKLYEEAIKLNPQWDSPYYNLGLIYKYRCEWQKSYECNKQAANLNPENEAAWWNLGIAATALLDWRAAREAWNKFGLNYEVNDDVTDFDLGRIPIRLNPETNGEVVWCKRIDPARAVIYNIPLPDSGYRFGDLLLNDGAPVGQRISNGVEYPVLNELQLLQKSSYKTYSVVADIEGQISVDKLETLCKNAGVEMEDWSTIKYLCKKCSEGTPHEHHDADLIEAPKQRNIGFATLNYETLKQVLENWRVITLCDHSDLALELE